MKKIAIYALVLFLLIYVLPLNIRPIVIPDETRYGEISREMVKTGDWIVPKLNGLRYFEKPVLGHWLNAVSIITFGKNAFAIRLPSALSGGLSALILFLLILRCTGDLTTAIFTASVFLTCLEIFLIGTFCILDSMFSMFLTASVASFYCGFTDVTSLRKFIFLAFAGIACGLAFLTKGFLAFVIPVIIIFPFALWQHQFKKLLYIIWLPVIAAVLTALPWSIIIGLKEPDFWNYFFWVEHVDRFLLPTVEQHTSPFWFFIPVFFIAVFPWTGQIASVIYKLVRTPVKSSLMRFAICWFLFPFLFFSVCSGKLLTYILPCIPPLIVMFTVSISREVKTATSDKINQSCRIGVFIIVVLIIVLPLTQILIPSARIYRANEYWKLLLIATGLVTYAIMLFLTEKSKRYEGKLFFPCLAPLLLLFCVPFYIPDKFIESHDPINFLLRYKDRIDDNTILVSDDYLTPAVCWCYGRSDVFLFHRAGEFTYGLEYDSQAKGRFLSLSEFNKLITEDLNKKHVVLITFTKRYLDYKQRIPKPFFENSGFGFVFAEFGDGLNPNLQSVISKR
jgi:4-amino-4-deoxy-L-arabinose transferase